MVLFSGGVKNDDDAAVLRKVKLYMECGATGVMFGRNMWLRPMDEALALTRRVRALAAAPPALRAAGATDIGTEVLVNGWSRRDCMKKLGGGVVLGAGLGGGLPTWRRRPRRRRRQAPRTEAKGDLAARATSSRAACCT